MLRLKGQVSSCVLIIAIVLTILGIEMEGVIVLEVILFISTLET